MISPNVRIAPFVAASSIDIRYRISMSSGSMAKSADLLQGTLDLLILRTLELEPPCVYSRVGGSDGAISAMLRR